VVASVRWTHKTADACILKNLWSLDRKLERRWPRRPLTIVGGDFNTAADKRVVLRASDAISGGREADPGCWYRAFTPLIEDVPERETSAGPGNSRCRGGVAPNSYYDTVAVASRTEDEDAICNQWTYSKNLRAETGTSCTDINADGKRDRTRIDYIWVRWEGRDGRPVTLSLAEATKRVELARADVSWPGEEHEGDRYSDHRATYATVRYGSDA